MGQNSKIEWTHHTFNPWRGCTKISDGCRNCYAEKQSKRNLKVLGEWGPNGTRVVASESMWAEPLKWDRWAASGICHACGGSRKAEPCTVCLGTGKEGDGQPYRARVFCASLADVFEAPATMPDDAVPVVAAARSRLFDLIPTTPNLDWLILTKRPEFAREWLSGPIMGAESTGLIHHQAWPFPNVWLGASIEDQKAAKERIPILLDIPAKVHFLSVEPLLGPLDIADYLYQYQTHTNKPWPYGRIDWVIVGGESGNNANISPMHPNWPRGIRDQCQDAGVPFFFKQWGEWVSGGKSSGLTIDDVSGYEPHRFEDGIIVNRVGKHNAGRLLNGRTWDEVPL